LVMGKGKAKVGAMVEHTKGIKGGKGFQPERYDDRLPYEPYTDDLELGTAFNRVDGFMTDLKEDEAFMRTRVKYGLISLFLCLLGIFLVFFARAEVISKYN
jgi:hypothetical protein